MSNYSMLETTKRGITVWTIYHEGTPQTVYLWDGQVFAEHPAHEPNNRRYYYTVNTIAKARQYARDELAFYQEHR